MDNTVVLAPFTVTDTSAPYFNNCLLVEQGKWTDEQKNLATNCDWVSSAAVAGVDADVPVLDVVVERARAGGPVLAELLGEVVVRVVRRTPLVLDPVREPLGQSWM